MRRRLSSLSLVAAVVATALVPVGPAVAQDQPLEVFASTLGTDLRLTSHDNSWAEAFSSPGDGFEVFQRGVSSSIPFALLDDTSAGFEADEIGIVGTADDFPFFGVVDTVNNDTTGPVSASFTFDLTETSGPYALAVAAGAMGDFEAADQVTFRASFDGGAQVEVLTTSVDEAAQHNYFLDNGKVVVLNDPMSLGGVDLDDDFRDVLASLPGNGDVLTLTVTATMDGGSEAFAITDLRIVRDDHPPAPTVPVACDQDVTLVSRVQGPGAASPIAGDVVTVRGVVSLVTPGLDGFFLQEEPADVDGDPATSEGVFVYDRDASVAAGDVVAVEGRVGERFGNTQISGFELTACGAGEAIAPTALTLPAGFAQREALEGMLVATTQDLAVTGLYTAYRFNELGVALDGPLVTPTSVFAPDDVRAEELVAAQADRELFIGDRGEYAQRQDAPWFTGPDSGRAGDLVPAGFTGALYYSFGDHLLQPVAFPTFVQAGRPAAPALDGGNDLGAFNVLNFFNSFDGRGARNPQQFALQSTKIVKAILAMDAAVLGIVEVENDYEDLYDGDDATVPSMQTLVDLLNDAAGADVYDWVRPQQGILTTDGDGGLGSDQIAVGLLFQPARATLLGQASTFDIDAQLGGADPENNRWPLAQTFRVDGSKVRVVVNHFKSKGSTCTDTSGPGFAEGDDVESSLTGNCNLVRTYAANQLLEWLEGPVGANTEDTFVVGDLNAYAMETPVTAFLDAGWTDVIAAHGDDAPTYKFDGRFGRLDHVLASPSAARLVRDAAVWRVNSPEPYGFLYYLAPVDDSAYASSDHDPVLVDLRSKKQDQAQQKDQRKG